MKRGELAWWAASASSGMRICGMMSGSRVRGPARVVEGRGSCMGERGSDDGRTIVSLPGIVDGADGPVWGGGGMADTFHVESQDRGSISRMILGRSGRLEPGDNTDREGLLLSRWLWVLDIGEEFLGLVMSREGKRE